MVKAGAIRLRCESESWNKEEVMGITATPWNLSGTIDEIEDQVIYPEAKPEIEKEPDLDENEVRDVQIRKEIRVKFGYTKDCPKYRAMMRGISMQKGHTEECRNRVKECMSKDEEEKKIRQYTT